MVTVDSDDGNLVFEEDIAEIDEKTQELTFENDKKDLYALFVIPILGLIISGVVLFLKKLGFRLVRGIFNAMEHDDSDSHLSISSSNVPDVNFYVSSDTSSEDEIMILDAAVQTSFKSEENDSKFDDDDNDLLNKEMPEEVIYLNIDTIEVNFQEDINSSTSSGLIYK